MSSAALLVAAILLMAAGHLIKACRWRDILATYEDVPIDRLLKILAIGQSANMVLPFRLGDAARILLLGRQGLKNGYILSFSSVVVDIFIDLLTVGAAFVTLYMLGIHRPEVRDTALFYGLLSLALLAVMAVFVWQKRRVKRLILLAASLFNNTIERRILFVSYTVFASIKEWKKPLRSLRLGACTAGVWICYFLSYTEFAAFLQMKGFVFTLTSVFKTIFSMAGSPIIWDLFARHELLGYLVWFALYLFAPLALMFLIATAIGRVKHKRAYTPAFHRILPQLNDTDKLAFLNQYFGETEDDYLKLYLSMLENVSILRDLSTGSDASTVLCVDETSTFYRKYAFYDGAVKLRQQIAWLQENSDALPLAKVLRVSDNPSCCSYDMLYLPEAVSLFESIHSSPFDQSWSILSDILSHLESGLYGSCSLPGPDTDMWRAYIDAKVTHNLSICADWARRKYAQLIDSEALFINGMPVKSLSGYAYMLSEESLLSILPESSGARIHGDLTVENIIVSPTSEAGWYLIDPNASGACETVSMDYAKLLQSLHGKYEFLMMVRNVRVDGNHIDFSLTDSEAYKNLYDRYHVYLRNRFGNTALKRIYCHEIVHWLRLMPYKIRKNPETAVVFYAGLLLVLNDVERMFFNER